MERERLQIGIDIGSTTTKIVAVNQDTDEITYSEGTAPSRCRA